MDAGAAEAALVRIAGRVRAAAPGLRPDRPAAVEATSAAEDLLAIAQEAT